MIVATAHGTSDRECRSTDALPTILFIAGFGDNASMFDGLSETDLADGHHLLPINLPGFGAPALKSKTTLEALSEIVADTAKQTGAEIIVAHSVASIIASLAAEQLDCPIKTIISLEGNITAEDAYFSGTAADYDDPHMFRTAFLNRLDEMAADAPIIARYRQSVSQADPMALWQLGTDVRHFSTKHVPGEILKNAAKVVYFYNPENCPNSTLRWLENGPMDRIILNNATHWKSVDQPEMLADKMPRRCTKSLSGHSSRIDQSRFCPACWPVAWIRMTDRVWPNAVSRPYPRAA